MRIGGARFDVGLTRNEAGDDEHPAFALKVLIFEVDAPETIDRICADIADILTHIDPDLDLMKLEGRSPAIN